MKCPLLNKDCIEAKCRWWGEFLMRHKPGDPPHVEHDCVVTRVPSMLVELISKTNSVGAAVENRGNGEIAGISRLVSVFEQAARRQELLEGG